MAIGGGIGSFVLLVFAFVCFAVAAWPLPDPRPGRLGALGLMFLAGSLIAARLGG